MDRIAIRSSTFSLHPIRRRFTFVALLLTLSCAASAGQTALGSAARSGYAADTADANSSRLAEMEDRLNKVTVALTRTQKALQESSEQIQQLRVQIEAMRTQMPVNAAGVSGATTATSPSSNENTSAVAQSLESIQEEQNAVQAEIKQHDQTKVETSSKYPVRISGLALFNAFFNAGVVDNVELPTLAFPRASGASHGSAGATLRQTVLALDATGPRLGSARSSARIGVDFFGGTSSNMYGYNSAAGVMRMREAMARLDWDKTTVDVGYSRPFISPLSPDSYATVAQPALAGSGNLWSWSPQLRVEQRVPFVDGHALALEGGFIYPQSPGYTAIQLDSPVESSRHPGYEGRVSYRNAGDFSDIEHSFEFGIGAYSSNLFYNSSTRIHAWAVTGDWRIPVKWFELRGEIYRGRSLGGLGGGAYKDTLTGKDVVTGLAVTRGVEAAGGWSQLKLRLGQTFEANAMFGFDNAFSSNFEGLVLSPSPNPFQAYARNSTVAGNLIFRPRTYLILSPEYRRILSRRYSGTDNVANVFTITAGYQF